MYCRPTKLNVNSIIRIVSEEPFTKGLPDHDAIFCLVSSDRVGVLESRLSFKVPALSRASYRGVLGANESGVLSVCLSAMVIDCEA